VITVASETGVRRGYAPRLPAEARQEQLLDTALALALERGFHAVTIDAVARAAGVTRPVVYGQFVDRTALLAAVVARAERRSIEQLTAALPPVPAPGDAVDPDALLVDGLAAFLSAVAADPATWRVVLLPPEGAPAELRARFDLQRRAALRHLRDLVAWGLERRGGPSGLDVDLFARSVQSLAEGAAQLVLADPARYPIDRLTAFARAALSALQPSGAPR
jgi:AcrR family transcriptional regulator